MAQQLLACGLFAESQAVEQKWERVSSFSLAGLERALLARWELRGLEVERRLRLGVVPWRWRHLMRRR